MLGSYTRVFTVFVEWRRKRAFLKIYRTTGKTPVSKDCGHPNVPFLHCVWVKLTCFSKGLHFILFVWKGSCAVGRLLLEKLTISKPEFHRKAGSFDLLIFLFPSLFISIYTIIYSQYKIVSHLGGVNWR